MEVTKIAAWAVIALVGVGLVYAVVKSVVECLRDLGEDDGWFDDVADHDEPEEGEDAGAD